MCRNSGIVKLNDETMAAVIVAALVVAMIGTGGFTILQDDSSSSGDQGINDSSPFESTGGPLIRNSIGTTLQEEAESCTVEGDNTCSFGGIWR
jgi:hypothetical protein